MRRTRHLSILATLCVILAISAAALALGPTRFLPGDTTIGAAAGNQTAPAIAKGSDTLLAVWADQRAFAAGSGYEFETSSDIYGIRLDASGNPIEAAPFVIADGQSNQENPQVVWNGANWLVMFESYSISGTGYYYQKSLAFVRVGPTGQVLDPRPIPVYNVIPTVGMWALASDGNNWVVAFQGAAASYDLTAVRISPAGVVLDAPTRSFVPATYYTRTNLNLAYASGVFLLTYDDDYNASATFNTRAVRFDSNLNLLDTAPILLVGVPLSDLTSNGSTFYAVWHQQQPNFTMAVIGSRLNTLGQKLDGSGDNISGTHQPEAFTATRVVWDGTNWRITWGYQGVAMARVNTSGQVLDPGGILLTGPSTGNTAPTSTGGVQIVWSIYQSNQYDVLSANISSASVAGTNRTLSLGAPAQTRADAATSGSGYMVVFRSDIVGVNRVMAQPLDASGNALTTQPIQLDSGDNLTGPGTPSVAWNGSVYLATWGNSAGIVAMRLQPNGTKIDAAPFVVMTPGFGTTDVEAMGDTFLVVGLQFGFTAQIINPVAARVRGSDGVVLDPTPKIIGGSYSSKPKVVVLGGRWLVAWQQNATHDDPAASTMAVFVNADGTSLTPFAVYSYSTVGGNGIFDIGLASSGSVALTVQSAELISGVETDLVARLINSDGTLQAAVNLTPWIGNQYRPRAAWDGSQFVVVYSDQKNRDAPWTLDQLDARADLFGMRLSATGAIVDANGFLFSNSLKSESHPNVTAANGVSLILASIMRADANLGAYRIGYGQFGTGGNQWPVVIASATPGGGDTPLTVAFSSAGSTDPNGSIASYLWDFGDGATSTLANPSHTYTTGGPFVATLTVTDNGGAQTTNTVLVQATLPNQIPVANASANLTSGPAPLDVIFYAAGSYDPDGSIGNIQWTFSDGGEYWGGTAYHTFYTQGTHLVTLTIYDSRGATGTDTLTVVVGQANQPPVAAASATPTSGVAPLAVNFSSTGSYDPDGAIASYAWTFGDGGTSTLTNPSHTYSTPGTYIAALTVTDNLGAINSMSVTITVTGSGCTSNCLRSTAITLSAKLSGSTVSASGRVTVKNESGVAVSGATVYATWTLPGGSTVSQTAVTNRSGLATFKTQGGRGTYTFTVTNIAKTGYAFDAANSVLTKSITK